MSQNCPPWERILTEYELLKNHCARYTVRGLSLLAMTGVDRKEWLQGQCTNDLRKLSPAGSISFCVCNATGHLISICQAWEQFDRIVLAVPTETLSALFERVESLVIMEDVLLEDLTDRYHWISVQGPTAKAKLEKLVSLPLGDTFVDQQGEALPLRTLRFRLEGWDLLIPKEALALGEGLAHIPEACQESLEILRVEAGEPLFGKDMNEKTLPPELGALFEDRYISYNKGCYTGQEILMRIHSRGHTNRTMVGLVLNDAVAEGAHVSHSSREDAGTVTSAVYSPGFGYIALASLRNEAAQTGDEVVVDGVRGSVVGLPFEL